MESHTDDVVAITYHVDWPGYDPFWYHNTTDNGMRRTAYGVNYVPWVVVGGSGDVGSGGMTSAYNSRVATPTDVTVEIEGDYDAGSGLVSGTVRATTTSALPDGAVQYRIYAALTETDIFYAGSNGVNIHDYTLRDMYPTGNGNVVTFTGDFPQSAEVNFEFTVDPEYAPENCRVVGFMQEAISKEVYNAEWAWIDDLGDPTDVVEIPASFKLGRNFPNPFNPKTSIPLSMETAGEVLVEVVSADGRRVTILHDGLLDSGDHEFTWNGRDTAGRSVASGVYMARVTGNRGSKMERMVLMK